MQNESGGFNKNQSRSLGPLATTLDAGGYIVNGTTVTGKVELLEVLKMWLKVSSTPTIGDIGSFGRRPCILISLDNDQTAVLNADTKRVAVKQYVEDALERGVDAVWLVVPNRNGRANKLVFREDGSKTRGWYCYSRQLLSANQRV